MSAHFEKLYDWLIAFAKSFRSAVLLVIRLFWGWQFFLTGKSEV